MEILTDSDLGGLLRIAGEVNDLPHNLEQRRVHILNGLLAIVGGCGAACSEIQDDSGWCVPGTVTVAGSFMSHAQMTQQYLTGGLAALDPCVPHLLHAKTPVVTFRRGDVIGQSWYSSAHYTEIRRPLGIGESLYAKFTTPAGRHLKLSLHRELNDTPYTEHHVRLIHLFNQNLSGLYAAPPTPDRPSKPDARQAALPPHLSRVLQRLLAGDSEKEAARKLALSPHSVHAYTKALYRAFNVSSRAELLAQFVVQ